MAMIMLDLCATDSEHLRKHLRQPCRLLVEQSLSLTLRPSPVGPSAQPPPPPLSRLSFLFFGPSVLLAFNPTHSLPRFSP